MTDRRQFLKSSLALSAAAATTMPFAQAHAANTNMASGVVYSTDNPGKWSNKAGSHAPAVKIEGDHVNIQTNHGMTEAHYIVRHTLVTESGEVVGAKTFSPKDKLAVSSFKLPKGAKKLYATSFCNKHDLWITPISV